MGRLNNHIESGEIPTLFYTIYFQSDALSGYDARITALENAGSGLKIESGTYTGTGEASITISFTSINPQVVFIQEYGAYYTSDTTGRFYQVCCLRSNAQAVSKYNFSGSAFYYFSTLSWGDKILTMTNTSSDCIPNNKGNPYSWLAIG